MRSSPALPAGSLRQRVNVLLRSGRDHYGCVGAYAVVDSPLACPDGPL
jgi:hypothetical protein